MREPIKIVLTQDWFEDSNEKTGWVGTGFDEPPGFEMVQPLDIDKYGNVLSAEFQYSGHVPFDADFAANQIFYRLTHEIVEMFRTHDEFEPRDVLSMDRCKKLYAACDVLKELYNIWDPKNK
jgi:hypothetical protein